MYQIIARIVGTIFGTYVIGHLKTWGFLPNNFILTPDQIEIAGYGILAGGALVWNRLEARAKGLTPSSPNPPSNIPSLETPVKELNTKATILGLNPATPESKL